MNEKQVKWVKNRVLEIIASIEPEEISDKANQVIYKLSDLIEKIVENQKEKINE